MKTSLKILSVLFAFVMLFSSFTFPTSARSLADIEAEIEKNEKELEQMGNRGDRVDTLEKIAEQRKVLDEQVQAIEDKIAPIQKNIDELNVQIEELESKIATLETEIATIDAQIAEQNVIIDETYELLSKRLRAAYMAGETSELEIFLSATDFQDFLNRTEMIRQISKHDTTIVSDLEEQIDGLNKMVEDLTTKRNDLDKSRQKLEADKAQREAEKAVYEQEKAKKEKAIAQNIAYERKENEIIGKMDQKSAYIQKLMEEARIAKEKESQEIDKDVGNSGSSGSGTVSGSTGHGFKLSSKGTICPIQESGVKYSANFASHSARGTASVDLVSYKNRYVSNSFGSGTYWTTWGANLYAMADGVVVKSTYVSSTYGHYVSIDHGNGLNTTYAHMSSRSVTVGQTVKQGQIIGKVGNTGNCWPRPNSSNPAAGAHLHLEVRVNGNRVNPEPYIPIPVN
ncbi:MAG: peptidoglycan DD-metalloendopeptidase family protein [Clostridia bacterium]|nr:peptidoglycan DD-metalloendopeptidase family protein [Clostridia bacterium]